ncbi:TPA: hypothetical protein ACFMWC_001975, partial [Neisseria lactamica]
MGFLKSLKLAKLVEIGGIAWIMGFGGCGGLKPTLQPTLQPATLRIRLTHLSCACRYTAIPAQAGIQ